MPYATTFTTDTTPMQLIQRLCEYCTAINERHRQARLDEIEWWIGGENTTTAPMLADFDGTLFRGEVIDWIMQRIEGAVWGLCNTSKNGDNDFEPTWYDNETSETPIAFEDVPPETETEPLQTAGLTYSDWGNVFNVSGLEIDPPSVGIIYNHFMDLNWYTKIEAFLGGLKFVLVPLYKIGFPLPHLGQAWIQGTYYNPPVFGVDDIPSVLEYDYTTDDSYFPGAPPPQKPYLPMKFSGAHHAGVIYSEFVPQSPYYWAAPTGGTTILALDWAEIAPVKAKIKARASLTTSSDSVSTVFSFTVQDHSISTPTGNPTYDSGMGTYRYQYYTDDTFWTEEHGADIDTDKCVIACAVPFSLGLPVIELSAIGPNVRIYTVGLFFDLQSNLTDQVYYEEE